MARIGAKPRTPKRRVRVNGQWVEDGAHLAAAPGTKIHLSKRRLVGLGLLALLLAIVLLVAYQWLTLKEELPEEPEVVELPEVVVPPTPDHYLSEHFRDELGACYAATGQRRTSVQLERAIEDVGRAEAVTGLLKQYRTSVCIEPDQALAIRGRALWLFDAVNAGLDE